MLRNVHLHGSLANTFQPTYTFDVETPAEALRALMIQVPGFEKAIRDGEFVCVRGSLDSGVDCDEELLKLNLGNVKDFHILPAAVGAGRGGGKVLLGIALIAATVFTAGAFFAAAPLGMSMGSAINTFGMGGFLSAGMGGLGLYTAGVGALFVLSGAAQALSVMPSMNRDLVDRETGYLFNGAVNTSEQGSAVPLVFGRIRAGSVIVSAGITAERTGSAVSGSSSSTETGAEADRPTTSGDITNGGW